MRALLIGLLASILLGLPATAQIQPTMHDLMATAIKVQGADCALFPAVARLDTLDILEPITGRFAPVRQQVEAAETQLHEKGIEAIRCPVNEYDAANLDYIQKHLGGYKRQYFGFINSQGQVCLFIQFFESDNSDWLFQHLIFLDGGPSVWETCYNLDTKQFYGIGYHSQG